jgi:hypothetical protein
MHVVDAYDIGMNEATGIAAFPFEERYPIFGRIGRNDLDDDPLLELVIFDEPDLAHSSFTERAD